jgi:hypothetical protein
MQDFARETGLDPPGPAPRRYLWTDAFAVCNYLGFFRATGEPAYRDLALRLVDQVHHTLGRHRDDDPRAGWISGLSPEAGEEHPTAGGLRIGKLLPERLEGEPFREDREWDRDGQYYHYLTKWMHALGQAGTIARSPDHIRWAVELARAAHARFTFRAGGRVRMYWKMSTDLSRPLVASMGQHDPLDGLVTFTSLQMAAGEKTGNGVLAAEIAELAGMVREMPLATDDPLGIGGLLADSARIVRLTARGGSFPAGLPESVAAAALEGLGGFSRSRCLDLPAGHRLAFRELGLAIGLAGIGPLSDLVREQPDRFRDPEDLERQFTALVRYMPVRDAITAFWLDAGNRQSVTWTAHRDINTVMLATSLAPGGFLEL